jgi:hypothetical protein
VAVIIRHHLCMTVEPRNPRPSRPAPAGPSEAVTGAGIAVTGIAVLAVVFYYRFLYFTAGVRYVDLLGSIAGVIAVVAAMAGAALVYRRGYRVRVVVGAGAGAVVVAVALALLAPLGAGSGWLTVVVAALLALVTDVLLAGWIVVAAMYLPLPWEAEGAGVEPTTAEAATV